MHKYATKISLMLVLLTPNSKIYVHYHQGDLFVKTIKFLNYMYFILGVPM